MTQNFLLSFPSFGAPRRPVMSDMDNWAAANGGVTNGGLRGVWPPFLEIGQNRPFSPIFCPFRPLPEGAKSTWEIQKTEETYLFPQISSDFLKHLLNPICGTPRQVAFDSLSGSLELFGGSGRLQGETMLELQVKFVRSQLNSWQPCMELKPSIPSGSRHRGCDPLSLLKPQTLKI